MKVLCCVMALFVGGCAAMGGKPSSGSGQDVDDDDKAKMAKVGEKVKGKVVWSSSRIGNHDIFIMKGRQHELQVGRLHHGRRRGQ
jgi:hypothetical protein